MTSQTQLTVTSDKLTEQADLAKIKRDVKDYTKDVSLSRLTHDDSLKFLSASLVSTMYFSDYCNRPNVTIYFSDYCGRSSVPFVGHIEIIRMRQSASLVSTKYSPLLAVPR